MASRLVPQLHLAVLGLIVLATCVVGQADLSGQKELLVVGPTCSRHTECDTPRDGSDQYCAKSVNSTTVNGTCLPCWRACLECPNTDDPLLRSGCSRCKCNPAPACVADSSCPEGTFCSTFNTPQRCSSCYLCNYDENAARGLCKNTKCHVQPRSDLRTMGFPYDPNHEEESRWVIRRLLAVRDLMMQTISTDRISNTESMMKMLRANGFLSSQLTAPQQRFLFAQVDMDDNAVISLEEYTYAMYLEDRYSVFCTPRNDRSMVMVLADSSFNGSVSLDDTAVLPGCPCVGGVTDPSSLSDMPWDQRKAFILSHCGTGFRCSQRAAQSLQYLMREIADAKAYGICVPCLLGEYCRAGTVERTEVEIQQCGSALQLDTQDSLSLTQVSNALSNSSASGGQGEAPPAKLQRLCNSFSPCPAGKYCPHPGEALDCAEGFFCSAGSIAPGSCDFHQVLENKTSPFYRPLMVIQSDPQFLLQQVFESQAPLGGNYCPRNSPTPVQACPPGKVCTNQSISQPCPKGYFCPPYTRTPKRCVPLVFNCKEGSRRPDVAPGGFVLLLCLMLLFPLFLGYIKWRSDRRNAHQQLEDSMLEFLTRMGFQTEKSRKGSGRPDDTTSWLSAHMPFAYRMRVAAQHGWEFAVDSAWAAWDRFSAWVASRSVVQRIMGRRQAAEGESFDGQMGDKILEESREAGAAGDTILGGFGNISPKLDLDFFEVGLRLPSGKRLLQGVSGNFLHGQMHAVMGPSGSGKSTFVQTLAGKAHFGRAKGMVRLLMHRSSNSGTRAHTFQELRYLTGFVPQEDILHTTLTVRENLMFSAKLRLNSDATQQDRKDVVRGIILLLGLAPVQHSVVGSLEAHGISGGQRKRVNIGMELVSKPSLLLLDEPTSGLDAAVSHDVLGSLRLMAEAGMNIITVIHQPRYSIFQMFDHVLLLGVGGRTVYFGPTKLALAYFEALNFKLPLNENPADFYLDVVSGAVGRKGDPHFTTDELFGAWSEGGEAWVERELFRQRDVGPNQRIDELVAKYGNAERAAEAVLMQIDPKQMLEEAVKKTRARALIEMQRATIHEEEAEADDADDAAATDRGRSKGSRRARALLSRTGALLSPRAGDRDGRGGGGGFNISNLLSPRARDAARHSHDGRGGAASALSGASTPSASPRVMSATALHRRSASLGGLLSPRAALQGLSQSYTGGQAAGRGGARGGSAGTTPAASPRVGSSPRWPSWASSLFTVRGRQPATQILTHSVAYQAHRISDATAGSQDSPFAPGRPTTTTSEDRLSPGTASSPGLPALPNGAPPQILYTEAFDLNDEAAAAAGHAPSATHPPLPVSTSASIPPEARLARQPSSPTLPRALTLNPSAQLPHPSDPSPSPRRSPTPPSQFGASATPFGLASPFEAAQRRSAPSSPTSSSSFDSQDSYGSPFASPRRLTSITSQELPALGPLTGPTPLNLPTRSSRGGLSRVNSSTSLTRNVSFREFPSFYAPPSQAKSSIPILNPPPSDVLYRAATAATTPATTPTPTPPAATTPTAAAARLADLPLAAVAARLRADPTLTFDDDPAFPDAAFGADAPDTLEGEPSLPPPPSPHPPTPKSPIPPLNLSSLHASSPFKPPPLESAPSFNSQLAPRVPLLNLAHASATGQLAAPPVIDTLSVQSSKLSTYPPLTGHLLTSASSHPMHPSPSKIPPPPPTSASTPNSPVNTAQTPSPQQPPLQPTLSGQISKVPSLNLSRISPLPVAPQPPQTPTPSPPAPAPTDTIDTSLATSEASPAAPPSGGTASTTPPPKLDASPVPLANPFADPHMQSTFHQEITSTDSAAPVGTGSAPIRASGSKPPITPAAAAASAALPPTGPPSAPPSARTPRSRIPPFFTPRARAPPSTPLSPPAPSAEPDLHRVSNSSSTGAPPAAPPGTPLNNSFTRKHRRTHTASQPPPTDTFDWLKAVVAQSMRQFSTKQAASHLETQNVPWRPKDLQSIKDMFRRLDSDHDGVLEFEEFIQFWNGLKRMMSTQEWVAFVARMITDFDIAQDGKITEEQFMTVIKKKLTSAAQGVPASQELQSFGSMALRAPELLMTKPSKRLLMKNYMLQESGARGVRQAFTEFARSTAKALQEWEVRTSTAIGSWHPLQWTADTTRMLRSGTVEGLKGLFGGEVGGRHLPSTVRQTRVIFHRSYVKWFNEKGTLVMDTLLLAGVALLIGVVQRHPESISRVPSNAAMALVAFGVMSTVTGLRTFASDLTVFVERESQSGLSTLAYFMGKLLWDNVELALRPAIFLSCYYLMTQFDTPFSWYYLILVMVSWYTYGFGYLASVLFSKQVALVFATAVPLICGAVINGASQPTVCQARKGSGWYAFLGISYSRWAIEGITIKTVTAAYDSRDTVILGAGALAKVGYCDMDLFLNLASCGTQSSFPEIFNATDFARTIGISASDLLRFNTTSAAATPSPSVAATSATANATLMDSVRQQGLNTSVGRLLELYSEPGIVRNRCRPFFARDLWALLVIGLVLRLLTLLILKWTVLKRMRRGALGSGGAGGPGAQAGIAQGSKASSSGASVSSARSRGSRGRRKDTGSAAERLRAGLLGSSENV